MPRAPRRNSRTLPPEVEQRLIHVPEPSTPAVAPAPPKHLEVTPAVKQAATVALNAIGNVDFEELSELHISTVCLRCVDEKTATGLADQLSTLAKTLSVAWAGAFTASAREVSAPLACYLPDNFTALLNDAADTDLASVPVQNGLGEQLKAFATVFSKTKIVRAGLETSDDLTQPNVDELKLAVRGAHNALLTAASLVSEALSDHPVQLVSIEPSGNFLNDLRFVVDGETMDLSERPQRALCVLALMQPTQPFSCAAFTKLYSGSVLDPRRDFYTVMRALKNDLPQLDVKAEKGIRWVRGVRVTATVAEKQLRAFLTSCLEK